ncbi:GlxA family transcriptional regulator [Undibacterium terreum]|uniref:Transcriptional regulator n=1 Tax=Undibacterium terreum TaxID=1224302 RepID=A0A916UCI8_9BURK|nr:GlxA family transcriptional regulator [Undibacterium terreum]GGC67252.1 transcriptional regulator [Undibacterium terreum]
MPTVALLAFPGVQALDVSGPLDVFSEANRFLTQEHQYRLELLGTERGLMSCSNGMPIAAHRHYSEAVESFDLLLVAGGPELPRQPRDEALSAWLQAAARRSKRHGSICNGAFLLGHAGLLEGKRVTTHWNDVAALARMFPQATVDGDRIYLQDGDLFTSAGVTAGIDLSLYLLSADCGAEVSLHVAKRLVVFTQRRGGQSQFSPYLTPYVEEGSPVSTVQQYVLAHLEQELSVESLAAIASMSPRNFARVFVRDARMTPAEFIESARLDEARVLLESTPDPLKRVAHRCGFSNVNQMRSVFVKRLGVTAKQYRDNFEGFKKG